MNLILFDDEYRGRLRPFTLTRPEACLRVGIMTIAEKWEKYGEAKVSFLTQDYLAEKFPVCKATDNFWVAGSILPDAVLADEVRALELDEALCDETGTVLACRNTQGPTAANLKKHPLTTSLSRITRLPDIFLKNEEELRKDFALLTCKRKSAPLSATNRVIGSQENVFLEEGAVVEDATLNVKDGPIYIGKNAEVMEGVLVRGPFAMCEHAQLKMGAKVYGATTLGPWCKSGGELSNVVFFGFSNKAHDGFLGNSVVGEWCNFGADTNASNLKNNYGHIKLWDYEKAALCDTGLQFCGLFMGDHSKCGINSMFNSGTVVGVACNLFDTGFHPNFVDSFSYGSPEKGYERYRFDKAMETAEQAYHRRHKELTGVDKAILRKIFDELA